MRIGSLRKMIGFEYKGQVAYITRMDDFRDYMEPEVYEAVRKAFENGFDGGIRQEYEELLEDEVGDIDAVQAEREECEEERDALQEKVDTLTHHIEELINQYYQRYIKTEEIIPELEKLI
jgi:cell division septum initiation protein DivIVA|nr:MAG TPA: hypothetical protein [Caudoviricetes sp.]